MRPWVRMGVAGVVPLGAGWASAAPELLINGGGEYAIHHGWQVSGPATTTGALRDGQGGILGPCDGLGFIVLGPGGLPQISQSGIIPRSADRLGLRSAFRRPNAGAALVTLRLRDDDGAVLAERTYTPQLPLTWGEDFLTLAVPRAAETWEIVVLGVFPGSLGIHIDQMSLIGTCLIDFNADRLLNFFDIAAYLTLYLGGDLEADLTGDGDIDFFDISELIDSFSFGCE